MWFLSSSWSYFSFSYFKTATERLQEFHYRASINQWLTASSPVACTQMKKAAPTVREKRCGNGTDVYFLSPHDTPPLIFQITYPSTFPSRLPSFCMVLTLTLINNSSLACICIASDQSTGSVQLCTSQFTAVQKGFNNSCVHYTYIFM